MNFILEIRLKPSNLAFKAFFVISGYLFKAVKKNLSKGQIRAFTGRNN